MQSVWSVSRLLTESVGSCHELVVNSVLTADATQLDSCVTLAVCFGHKPNAKPRKSYTISRLYQNVLSLVLNMLVSAYSMLVHCTVLIGLRVLLLGCSDEYVTENVLPINM